MAKKTKEKEEDKGIVYIGSKPTMNYVLAVVTQFHNGAKEVHLKARGKAITRAVDVSEIVQKKFMDDVERGQIKTDTETMEGEEGEEFNVSSIDIPLRKKEEE